LRDLGTIENTFVHILRGVLHHRIEYPDPNRELQAKGPNDAWVREALSDAHEPITLDRNGTPPWRTEPEIPVRDRRRKRAAQRKAKAAAGAEAAAHFNDEAPAVETNGNGAHPAVAAAVKTSTGANGAVHHFEEPVEASTSNSPNVQR
jgi:hypothetical protein